jgi:hypothetical protein
MNNTFIPADATLAELQKKAADCEQRATQEPESLATALREEAQRYRKWIAALRSGHWTA